MKRIQSLFFVFLIIVSFSTSLNNAFACSQIHVEAQVTEESSPLESISLDLDDVLNFLDDGDKKAALATLKSAGSELRKVKGFDAKFIKEVSNGIKKATALVKAKKGDLTKAEDLIIDLIDKIESVLSPEDGNGGDNTDSEEDL